MTQSDALSATFSALADPTRRAILSRLAEGPATVKELASPFAMSGPAVSKHLRVLERAGLISRGRDAQRRPCQLRAVPLRDVSSFAERYRPFWEESFDRLDEYLHELQAQPDSPQSSPSTKKQGASSHARRNRKPR